MVKKTESQAFTEVTALVEDVIYEPAQKADFPNQYHLILDAKDQEIKGKTGKLHEWIAETGTCTEDSVPVGSVIERYVDAIENIEGEKEKVADAFKALKGNSYLFKKKVLGKSFEGHKAREYLTPIKKA